ncbi:MAG: cysteine desulfurase [Oscillospiraceae bacterium]|nr:cysteine desulfurase [Oscillospiraceae bacterium]
MIYLDNAATTRPAESVIRKAGECMSEHFGNPSSLHKLGLDAELYLKQTRKMIADSIGTEPETVLFTSGATESSNLALRGIASVYGKRNKKKIITSAVEHASVRSTLAMLEQQGYEIIRIQPDENGRFQADDFIQAADETTFLISMMRVENETGRILPVPEVFRRIRKKYPDIILHCDAVQAYMKLPVKLKDMPADLISFSAHKIHGIKGTGALYIRKGIRLTPILTGGKQEKSIRPGTEAVPLIAGFGEAVRLMQDNITERLESAQHKKEYLLNLLSETPDIIINSETDKNFSSPYIVNFSVKGIRSEIMLHYLESKEIYVSSGSACSKGAKSGVLSAYHVPDSLADCAIRVSFSEDTTEQELDLLVQAIQEGQANLIHKKS